MKKKATFGEVLEFSKFRTTGFDYLRIVLALMVVASHVPLTTYGPTSPGHLFLFFGWFRPFAASIVPIFFALSGFLVAGSLFRCKNLWQFGTLRVIRLMPALCVEVLLSAVLIGPMLTKFDLSHYFTDRQFWLYVLNVTGEIHYTLPGVFLDNPLPKIVNGQLWTIPSEMKCYVFLIILAAFRLHRRRALFLAATILIALALLAYKTHLSPSVMIASGHGQVKNLFVFFMCGVSIFLYRDLIPMDFGIFLGCTILSYVMLRFEGTSYLVCFPISYITVYVGLCDFRKTFIILGGDYSYGVYLYGFPVQQAIAQIFPNFHVWWFTFPVACGVSLMCAFASWNFIEKGVTDRKKIITTFVENVRVRAISKINLNGSRRAETRSARDRAAG